MKVPSHEEQIKASRKHKDDTENNFKDFLENFQLFRKCTQFVPKTFDNFSLKALHLFCNECQLNTTYAYTEDHSELKFVKLAIMNGGGTRANFRVQNGGSVKICYECQHCKVHRYFFLVSFENDKVFKSGQYPSFDVKVSKQVEEKLGPKLSKLYGQGKICEAQGYGIASMAYYRRVIEDKVREILLEIKSMIPEQQREEFEKEINSVMDLHSFEAKADFIYDSMPSILKPNGNNLLKLLFSTVSEGLHSKEEEACLELAADASKLLEMIIHVLNTQAETEKGLKTLSNRLLKAKSEQK